MDVEIELGEAVVERIDAHRDPDRSYVEFIEGLVNVYEADGTFSIEGYSE